MTMLLVPLEQVRLRAGMMFKAVADGYLGQTTFSDEDIEFFLTAAVHLHEVVCSATAAARRGDLVAGGAVVDFDEVFGATEPF